MYDISFHVLPRYLSKLDEIARFLLSERWPNEILQRYTTESLVSSPDLRDASLTGKLIIESYQGRKRAYELLMFPRTEPKILMTHFQALSAPLHCRFTAPCIVRLQLPSISSSL